LTIYNNVLKLIGNIRFLKILEGLGGRMKRAILLGIVSILFPLKALFAQGGPCDFNGNGYPDVNDLINLDNLLQGCFYVDTLPDYWPEGDCDQDSLSVTISDALALGIRLIYGHGHAQGQVVESMTDTISIPSASAEPGQTLTLPVHLYTSDPVNGAQFYLLYDPTLLSITDISQPDSEPSNGFRYICFYGSGASGSALPFGAPGYFHDPLVYLTIAISPTAPSPSQARIEFADNPHRAAYTGLAVYDSAAVPPAPDMMFIRPVTVDGIISINSTGISNETAPKRDRLALDIWGNPSNLSYQILFHLPQASDVDLNVFDLLGRRLANLAGGRYSAGDHIITWDAGALASGIYFLRLATDDDHVTKRVTLLK
jgi:hypothetical protein